MDALTYTKTGTKVATATKLDTAVFTVVPTNHELLKLAYTTYLANGRENLAITKTRGLVRGGGKKPWQQKGTGRARVGSSRVPNWRGGGIAFGPTGQENYSMRLPVKAKRLALRQALSLAAADKKIRVIEAFEPKDAKVSQTVDLLQKLDAKGNVLLVVSEKNEHIERATRNVPSLTISHANYLNVFTVLNADAIVLTKPALDMVSAWLGVVPKAAAAEGDKS
jgi:large subunit ribosomal protein L4